MVLKCWRIFSLFLCFAAQVTALAAPSNPPPHDPPYPEYWWTPVSTEGAPKWEIFPQSAAYGEVILSKRHELGLLSNFAATPFTFHGKSYASVEGFWQGTKYPENDKDPRLHVKGVKWAHTRAEVNAMTAFQAKEAGNEASENMKKMGIDWVTFEGSRLTYKEPGDSAFYKLIVKVMRAKLEQNLEVRKVLLQTGDLVLKPDHSDSDASNLKAWRYYEIWMDLRRELKAVQ